jgi:hypothetical protein
MVRPLRDFTVKVMRIFILKIISQFFHLIKLSETK